MIEHKKHKKWLFGLAQTINHLGQTDKLYSFFYLLPLPLPIPIPFLISIYTSPFSHTYLLFPTHFLLSYTHTFSVIHIFLLPHTFSSLSHISPLSLFTLTQVTYLNIFIPKILVLHYAYYIFNTWLTSTFPQMVTLTYSIRCLH